MSEEIYFCLFCGPVVMKRKMEAPRCIVSAGLAVRVNPESQGRLAKARDYVDGYFGGLLAAQLADDVLLLLRGGAAIGGSAAGDRDVVQEVVITILIEGDFANRGGLYAVVGQRNRHGLGMLAGAVEPHNAAVLLADEIGSGRHELAIRLKRKGNISLDERAGLRERRGCRANSKGARHETRGNEGSN